MSDTVEVTEPVSSFEDTIEIERPKAGSPAQMSRMFIEELIKETSGEYTKNALYKQLPVEVKLPREVMSPLFMHIMDYLLESKKISVDRAGHICWTYSPEVFDYYNKKENLLFGNKNLKGCLFFEDEKILKCYTDLKNASNLSSQHVYASINGAAAALEENMFAGELIPRCMIPRKYNKNYDSCNLWRYNLGNYGNLIYRIFSDEDKRIVIIADWVSNKDYEKLF